MNITIPIIGGVVFFSLLKSKKMNTWDSYTNKRIKFLHPLIKDDVTAFINEAARKGYKLRITVDGHYRSFAKQKELYAKGRTAPGKVVTSAMPGQSYHNYGLAIDVVEIKNGVPLWSNPNWEQIGRIGEKHGFVWGGRWTKCKNCPDKPHFQKTFGKHHTDLLAMVKNKQTDSNGYVLLK
jgi:peptidoglycan L-alanyl-D-glutamate endopeptidase CwlK